MFTKADYLSHLHLLADKERDMMFGLYGLLDRVEDAAVAEQLQSLLQEKEESSREVSLIFDMLFGLAVEQQRYTGEPALGDVRLRNLETGEKITCRCIDVSLEGLCVQSSAMPQKGAMLAVEVRFFEVRRPVVRKASVIWCSRSEDGQYRAGLQFET